MAEPTRARSVLASVLPALALVLAVLLLLVPLRLFQGYVPTPLLPFIVIFLYALYDPDALPAPVIFAAGLLQDLLYGGPLGVWPSVYLLSLYLVTGQRTYFLGRAPDVVWLGFGVVLLVAMLLLWAEMSILSGGWLPLWPAVYQFVITGALYPVGAYLFFYLRARQGVREEWQV